MEPDDAHIACESNEIAKFACRHIVNLSSEIQPAKWIVNSIAYGPKSLPDGHIITHNGSETTISVKNIELSQNNTLYQCFLQIPYLKTTCTHRSRIAQLIIKGCNGKLWSIKIRS